MKTEAETVVMYLYAKEHRGLSTATRIQGRGWTGAPLEPPEGPSTADTSISGS